MIKTSARRNELIRAIGRWDLVCLIVNIVIGAGILGLPAKTFALVGVDSVAAWILCAAIFFLIVLCLAELNSRFQQTGGPYLYAHSAFGPGIGFAVGWLLWVSRLTSYAALSNLSIGYVAGFFPILGSGAPRILGITGLTALLVLLLLSGIRRSVFVNNMLTTCKLTVLIGFILFTLPFGTADNWHNGYTLVFDDWRRAVLLMSFAFVGGESALINAGEMKNPRTDAPFAMAAAIAIITSVYVLIQISCIDNLSNFATSERPLVDVAQQIYGSYGSWIVGLGGLIIMLGTMFSTLLTGTRLPFAFAEQDQLPALLRRVHIRRGVPYVAILVTSGLAWLLAINSSFLGAVTLTAFARLLIYLGCCVAVLILRKQPAASDVKAYRTPGGPIIPGIGILACLWLLSDISATELLTIALTIVVGAALTAGHMMHRRLYRKS